jgi:hypothetical protein
MNRLKFATLALVVGTALTWSGAASALVWNEDFSNGHGAGETLAAAQVPTAHPVETLTNIRGFLDSVTQVNATPRYQVDLYKIYVSDFVSFSATTVSSNEDDNALFLFDQTGKGVYANDDFIGLQAALPEGGPQAAGFYYLGIGVGGVNAFDAGGNNLFDTGAGIVFPGLPGAGPLNSFAPSFDSLTETSIAYDILLTGVRAVPEPQAALLLLLGLGALAARQAGRKRRA